MACQQIALIYNTEAREPITRNKSGPTFGKGGQHVCYMKNKLFYFLAISNAAEMQNNTYIYYTKAQSFNM